MKICFSLWVLIWILVKGSVVVVPRGQMMLVMASHWNIQALVGWSSCMYIWEKGELVCVRQRKKSQNHYSCLQACNLSKGEQAPYWCFHAIKRLYTLPYPKSGCDNHWHVVTRSSPWPGTESPLHYLLETGYAGEYKVTPSGGNWDNTPTHHGMPSCKATRGNDTVQPIKVLNKKPNRCACHRK